MLTLAESSDLIEMYHTRTWFYILWRNMYRLPLADFPFFAISEDIRKVELVIPFGSNRMKSIKAAYDTLYYTPKGARERGIYYPYLLKVVAGFYYFCEKIVRRA